MIKREGRKRERGDKMEEKRERERVKEGKKGREMEK